MTKKEKEQLERIATKIGIAAVEMAMEFLPRVKKALPETDKAISFGMTVKTEHAQNGVLECSIIPKAPKIPTPDIDETVIVLKLNDASQLELLFDGTAKEMAAVASEPEEPPDPYTPVDNARTKADAERGESATAEATAISTDAETVH